MTPRDLRWEDIFQNATLVKVSFSEWTAGVKLTPQDLGLTEAEANEVNNALSLGKHKLAPSGAFERIHSSQSKAISVLQKYGIPFLVFDRTFFVANDRMETVLAELEGAKRDRAEAVEEFVKGYPDMQKEVLPALAQALLKVCKTEDAAIKALERAAAAYPDTEALRDAFGMKWHTMTLTTSSYGAAMDGGKEIKDTVQGMVKSLRDDVMERLQATIVLARKGGKLSQKTIKATLETLGRVRDLNRIIGDPTLATQIDVLERVLSSGETDGDALLPSFEKAQSAMTKDIQAATDAAIEGLTGFGDRRIG